MGQGGGAIEAVDLMPVEEADRLIAEGHPVEDRGDFEAALALYRRAAQVALRRARGNPLDRVPVRVHAMKGSRREDAVRSPNYRPVADDVRVRSQGADEQLVVVRRVIERRCEEPIAGLPRNGSQTPPGLVSANASR